MLPARRRLPSLDFRRKPRLQFDRHRGGKNADRLIGIASRQVQRRRERRIEDPAKRIQRVELFLERTGGDDIAQGSRRVSAFDPQTLAAQCRGEGPHAIPVAPGAPLEPFAIVGSALGPAGENDPQSDQRAKRTGEKTPQRQHQQCGPQVRLGATRESDHAETRANREMKQQQRQCGKQLFQGEKKQCAFDGEYGQRHDRVKIALANVQFSLPFPATRRCRGAT